MLWRSELELTAKLSIQILSWQHQTSHWLKFSGFTVSSPIVEMEGFKVETVKNFCLNRLPLTKISISKYIILKFQVW